MGQYNTRLDKHALPTPITSSLHHSMTLVRRRQEAGLDRWVTVLEALTSAALDTTSNWLSPPTLPVLHHDFHRATDSRDDTSPACRSIQTASRL